MVRLKLRHFLFMIAALLVIFGLWSAYNYFSPDRLLPAAVILPAVRTVHTAGADPPPGVAVYPHLAPVNDVLPLADGYLLAAEGGLALADATQSAAFHRGGGLPVSRLMRLLSADIGRFALAPEGLLRLPDVLQATDRTMEITLISPVGDATLIDAQVIGEKLIVLDDRGRLLSFVEKKFQLLAELPPDPVARLGVLHKMPLVVARGQVYLVRDGRPRRIYSLADKRAPGEAASCLLFDGQRVLIGGMTGLIAVTEFGSETLLDDFAVTALARFGETVVLGGVHGEIRDPAGNRLATCPTAVRGLRAVGDKLLIAAEGGLYQLDAAGRLSPAAADDALRPLPEGYVTALLPVADGRVLVGTLNRGLVFFDPATGTASQNRLNTFGVNRIIRDGNGYLVATTNGLARLDDALAERQWWKTAGGLPGRYVSAVRKTDNGVFLATNAGLARLVPGGMQAIDAFHGLAGNHLYCLAAGERGDLAAGGLAGLSLLGGPDAMTVTKTYTAADGLPHNWVNAVLRAKNGWWVGTYGGGVVVLTDQGEIIPCPDTASWSINVNAAVALGSLTVFGTLENALALGRDPRRWTSFAAGLPSHNVTALALAGGALWVGTDHGLARLNLSIIEAALK